MLDRSRGEVVSDAENQAIQGFILSVPQPPKSSLVLPFQSCATRCAIESDLARLGEPTSGRASAYAEQDMDRIAPLSVFSSNRNSRIRVASGSRNAGKRDGVLLGPPARRLRGKGARWVGGCGSGFWSRSPS
jgi:hypothetical protein